MSARNARLRFQRPCIPSAEAVEAYFARSREARWFSNGGPCWRLLRERLAQRVDVDCVPVANATLGLMAGIAALAARAPAARTVLLPSFTFAATIEAAVWNGLRPCFVDVSPGHWHLDPDALDAALAAQDGSVALVLACSAFGTPPPSAVRRAWEAACARHGVPLLVDSAAGFGAAAADGTPVGAQGDLEVVSFHATKPFAIGEGGAVFGRDPELIADIERRVNFGFGRDRQVGDAHAFNGKLSEIHAATALAVLDGFDGVLAARRGAAETLRRRLDSSVAFQTGSEHATWQFVPVLLPGARERDACRDAAAAVETRVYYEPLHRMPAFAGFPATDDLAVTAELEARVLCLPMANDLTATEIDAIAAVVELGVAVSG